jgi:SsrA-binding protein
MAKGVVPTPRIVNKKARFEFELLDELEAGIALTGSEVKSLRAGQASLEEAFAVIRNDELFLRDCNISPYPMAGYVQHAPTRERKLLVHKRQIRKWHDKVTQRGYTIVPLAIQFNERGLIKVIVALAHGKTHGDKRADIKSREAKREMDRVMRRGRGR